MHKTKIIATLGPATDDMEVLREAVRAGMNVARFNFSHGDHATTAERLRKLRLVCEEEGCTVAALADTKGPEIRLGCFEGGKAELETGASFRLMTEECLGNAEKVYITYQQLPGDVTAGTAILLNDGQIELVVEDVSEREIVTRVVTGGTISDRKGVNVPSTNLNMPFISERDYQDIKFSVEQGFDFVAASFTRNREDVLAIRGLLKEFGGEKILIIAKIENSEGVEKIREIVEATDGIMVARGDLGVEMPLEDIPTLQKHLIRYGFEQGKIVVTATQMLESMISSPKPTRAEVSDVANAIYDGTSAIMLSGESAVGKYPVESIRMMDVIAEHTEKAIDYKERFHTSTYRRNASVVNAISVATVTTAHELGATAILTVSLSGNTARNVAKYRPACPIIVCSTEPMVVRQMSMVWGVKPLLMEWQSTTDALFEQAIALAQRQSGLVDGDVLVITAGVPLGKSGTTNLLKVHVVGQSAKLM